MNTYERIGTHKDTQEKCEHKETQGSIWERRKAEEKRGQHNKTKGTQDTIRKNMKTQETTGDNKTPQEHIRTYENIRGHKKINETI